MLYQNILDEFVTVSEDIIREGLTGIYLHGSMAMNCFNPAKSDIDLIIVIEHDITDVQKMEFMKQVVKLNEKAAAKGLEISVVKREYCKPFVYPTPFELHFSSMHLQWFYDNPENYVENMKGVDNDLAAHFTIMNKYGIVLYGEQIEEVFGEVPQKDYIDSIWLDVEGAREAIEEEPMYMILNLCRVLAFLKEDMYLSKQQGGEWAIGYMPKKYHPLIVQALDCYGTSQMMEVDMELAGQFADEMLTSITFEKEQIGKE